MVIGVVEIEIYTPWVHSLKEKRMIVKSICTKAKNKFNISIAEIAQQDVHQRIVLGFACVAGNTSHAYSTCDHVLNFIEGNTEGEIIKVDRQLL
ncbi:DUF503 domain-containing protein [Garciella nitratireducens]|nr:DUF503 domain-containing protein [Garciella nitratireducens]